MREDGEKIMPMPKEWYEHFQRLPAARITRMRGAIKVLMADSMFKEHYSEFYRLDYFLEKVQVERKKK
jgi:hypothetical protein